MIDSAGGSLWSKIAPVATVFVPVSTFMSALTTSIFLYVYRRMDQKHLDQKENDRNDKIVSELGASLVEVLARVEHIEVLVDSVLSGEEAAREIAFISLPAVDFSIGDRILLNEVQNDALNDLMDSLETSEKIRAWNVGFITNSEPPDALPRFKELLQQVRAHATQLSRLL